MEPLLLVRLRQERQHGGADFLRAVGEDVGPWMAEIVAQGEECDVRHGCYSALDDLGRLPLITAYHQQS